MEDIVPTVAALVLRDDKVLLVRHKEGAAHLTDTYGLPSGRIGDGESEKEAALRELKEETGLQATLQDISEF
ncbi:MAG: NUDIX hydrolase, partial [Candidatus Colwellbacteria bacterium]|nr:NUDIX hydrolase [Candidatus Colwellbacteria bacterium]